MSDMMRLNTDRQPSKFHWTSTFPANSASASHSPAALASTGFADASIRSTCARDPLPNGVNATPVAGGT